jgi:hypothetical protein
VSGRLGVLGDASPKVDDAPVDVVDRFDLPRMRTSEEHGSAAEERLYVVRWVAESSPSDMGDATFAAHPRERGA